MIAKFVCGTAVFSNAHEDHRGHTENLDILSLEALMASFLRLAERRLSDTQKQVLMACAKVLCLEKMTLTSLADVVSRASRIPYSTVKWNIRALVEMGLLVGGTNDDRGRPARLTPCARVLVEYLKELQDTE